MAEAVPTPPGWYDHQAGLRYWNGTDWTDHRAPSPPAAPQTIGVVEIIIAGVALGMVLGWALIWVGAQARAGSAAS